MFVHCKAGALRPVPEAREHEAQGASEGLGVTRSIKETTENQARPTNDDVFEKRSYITEVKCWIQ